MREVKAWRGGTEAWRTGGPLGTDGVPSQSLCCIVPTVNYGVTGPRFVTPRIRFSLLAVGNKLGQLQLWRHTLPSEYRPCGAAGDSSGETEEGAAGGSTGGGGTVLPGLQYAGNVPVHDSLVGGTGGAPPPVPEGGGSGAPGSGGGSGGSSGGGGYGDSSYVVASCWTLVPGPGRGGSGSGIAADGSRGGNGGGTSSAPPPRRWGLVEPRVGEAGDTLLLATGEGGGKELPMVGQYAWWGSTHPSGGTLTLDKP